MSAPHRGLPPPAAMTLADPSRGPPPPIPPSQQMGQMPPAPSQWQGAEESMRNWLVAKAEEDKRRQEEEKTRQEGLRLEQRKIEQAMLRDSMQGGIPPHLVPMIFAGIGGGNLGTITFEWLQQYAAQLQVQAQAAQQQQQQQQQQQAIAQTQASPELRRETKFISQPQTGAYTITPQGTQPVLPAAPVIPGQPIAAQPQHGAFSTPGYAQPAMSPATRPRASTTSAPSSAPRPPPHSQLPRLTTNEVQLHQPPSATTGVHTTHSQSAQEQQSSPSIYFHHWVPPTTQTGSDYTSSPKKRKAQGSHQAAPPPTSTPQYTSPSFSHVSSTTSTPGRRGHARTRSDASTRGQEAPGRPPSRHGAATTQAERADQSVHSESAQQQVQQAQRISEERNEPSGTGGIPRPGSRQSETRQSAHVQHSAGPEQGPAPGSPKQEAENDR